MKHCGAHKIMNISNMTPDGTQHHAGMILRGHQSKQLKKNRNSKIRISNSEKINPRS